MKMNSTRLMAVATAILMASTSAFAAVKNGASLKGNEYTKGGNNAKGSGVIAWNSFSSVDPTAFSHDLSYLTHWRNDPKKPVRFPSTRRQFLTQKTNIIQKITKQTS